jgi:four helix bundle protein
VKYSEWLNTVPETLKDDAVWTLSAYRYALFLSDLCWHDVTNLMGDKRTTELSSQLYDAVGSVGANLAEGYSRGSGRDRARFYEYSLGSARESRDWYFKTRHVLGEKVATHRLEFLGEIIRLTLTMIPDQRGSQLREEPAAYLAGNLCREPDFSPSLLEDVHMPD